MGTAALAGDGVRGGSITPNSSSRESSECDATGDDGADRQDRSSWKSVKPSKKVDVDAGASESVGLIVRVSLSSEDVGEGIDSVGLTR